MTAPAHSPETDVAERYIRLAHALDAHMDGLIDGYAGPAEWADRTRRNPAELKGAAEELLDTVPGVEDPARRGFLLAQARALQTVTRLLTGSRLPYAEEVRGLYDIEPPRPDPAVFEAALRELDAALPGQGPLPGRDEALRERVTVPPERLLALAGAIVPELRERSRQRFGLPDGEEFRVALVSDKPWGGYNWPLGNLQSLIEINTDLPVALTGLPDLLAHEGYPGHHTEHAGKEARLVRGRGWLEHSLQLIAAPECVVSEGIAVSALRAVMTHDEEVAWLCGDLAAHSGLDPEAVRAHLAAAQARRGLAGVPGAAALLLHEQERPEAEVLDFLQTYGALTPDRARQQLRFIANPTFRAYIFTYTVGGDLVRRYTEQRGPEGFAHLLSAPVTPGELRAALA